MRKLATIQKVLNVEHIENADNIEKITVLGWHLIARKGEFKPGDLCLFFEIDSLVPQYKELEFLNKSGIRKVEFDGKEYTGYRIKTIKLRGQISQGLALPLDTLDNICQEIGINLSDFDVIEGLDLSEELNIVKWEKPIPLNLRGKIIGYFPKLFPKTDLVRIQSTPAVLERWRGNRFIVQEKLDGQSITIYLYNNEFGVCSRNMELAYSDDDVRWTIVKNLDIENKLRSNIPENIAIQGEFIGQTIQDNRLKLDHRTIVFFDVFDIDNQCYYPPEYAKNFIEDMGLEFVPVIDNNFIFTEETTVDQLVVYVDKMQSKYSKLGVQLEGIAIKSAEEKVDRDLGRLVFKVINNSYLLKHDE